LRFMCSTTYLIFWQYSRFIVAVMVEHTWLKTRIEDLISGYKGRLNHSFDWPLWAGISMSKTYQLHLTLGVDSIIKAIKSEAETLLTLSRMVFVKTHTVEHITYRTYTQDLFKAARQEILDLCLGKAPRHALNNLIVSLELEKWFKSDNIQNILYAELLAALHPLWVVIKDQIIKCDHFAGYSFVNGTNTLVTTWSCCPETSSYVICTCNTLSRLPPRSGPLFVQAAFGVSHTQWRVITNHTFCLEVTEDFTIGELNILGRVPMNTDISPWWEDTYEMSTRSLMESMAMVQELLQDSSYHLPHSQVIVNLAKKTATILTSASLASAIYAYTWWDWVYRPCVLASQLVVTITLVQCCYCRHWNTSLRKTTSTSFAMAPLVLSQPRVKDGFKC
uniref:Uncharacterized protein n=1 Tax=Oncorhynchus kisutch TaxID=8019 RepID=A0A8C7JS09_ONCKI